jgi:hypothetical protein
MTLELVGAQDELIRTAPESRVDLQAGTRDGYRWLPQVYEPIPEGMQSTDWTRAVEAERVFYAGTFEPIPPAPVSVSVEDLARVLMPEAEDGAALVVGQMYKAGTTVTIDGKLYPVTRALPYTDPNWGYEHLRAHLGPEITAGPAPFRNGTGTDETPVFNPDIPVAAPDAYAVGERMIWPPNGQTYECLVSATVWGPNHVPASWQVIA